MAKMDYGKVFIVGAGPGNPKLLTLRAIECLKQADVILHDRLIPKEVLQLYAPSARYIYVGKKASFHTVPQDEIAKMMEKEARNKKRVVRLKGGDPYIFGRGGEEAEYLADKGISFEVIPGVSSAFAVPSFAGVPLTHREFTPSIAIVTGHENPKKPDTVPYQHGKERKASTWVHWPSLAKMGTVVFLMGVGNLRANMAALKKHGKKGNTPVAFIRWGSLGKQQTVLGTIDTIADQVKEMQLTAPAIIVVGGVAGLSKKLNWFERGSLHGQSFLITRDVEGNQVLADALLQESAHVIRWPSFKFIDLRLSSKAKTELKKISKYDWLIFSSKRAVDSFLKQYIKCGLHLLYHFLIYKI